MPNIEPLLLSQLAKKNSLRKSFKIPFKITTLGESPVSKNDSTGPDGNETLAPPHMRGTVAAIQGDVNINLAQ